MTGLVTQAELRPNEVQTIALVPGYHMTIEFPYPIARMEVGDDSVFAANKYANKLSLRALTQRMVETSVTITLADADLTVVPFIIRIDSLASRIQVLRYTDPLAQELNRAASRIAESQGAQVSQRVEQLSEARVRQRLLLAGPSVPLNRSYESKGPEGTVRVFLEQMQQLPSEDGQPRLYVRYRIENYSSAQITDLTVQLQAVRGARSIFGRAAVTPVYDVEDQRSSPVIQGGTSVLGILSLLTPDLAADETITTVFSFWNGRRTVRLERVIVGPPPGTIPTIPTATLAQP